MQIQNGTIIISSTALENTFFEQAIILITESNSNGAVGFILNHPFPKNLNDLIEFKDAASIPLFHGGPVDEESLFFIHQQADLVIDSIHIKDSIYYGGNFKAAVQMLNRKIITGNDLKIFIGYCGWNTGELEAEVQEGSWLITDLSTAEALNMNMQNSWNNLFQQFNNRPFL